MRKYLVWLFLLLSVACSGEDAVGETAVSPTQVQTTSDIIDRSLPDGFDAQGHRGARGLKPENTLPAFETALDLGVTTLELDLHYSSDGMVVIWHDDKIDGDKCGLDPDSMVEAPDTDSLINWGESLRISQLTYEQLQTYRCDRNPSSSKYPDQNNAPTPLAGDAYQIISLEELFEFVEDYAESELKSDAQRANALIVMFNIETKRNPNLDKAIGDEFDGENPGAFELDILQIVDQFGVEDRVVVQSFDHRSLWAIRSVNETIRLAALTSRESADITGMAENGANIWSMNFNALTPALVSKAHKVGLLVIPWTVNEADDMQELIEMGVDGIISDRPDILLNLEP